MRSSNREGRSTIKWVLACLLVPLVGVICLIAAEFPNHARRKAVQAIQARGANIEFGEKDSLSAVFLEKVNVEKVDFWNCSDDDLALVAKLPTLTELHVSGSRVTNAGVARLIGLPRLQVLFLADTQVTDEGLMDVAQLTQLEWLSLVDSPVTDDGMFHIERMQRLKHLDLSGTQVTDDGLVHLKRLSSLEQLFLFGDMRVSKEGIEDLQRSLPRCAIVYDADAADK